MNRLDLALLAVVWGGALIAAFFFWRGLLALAVGGKKHEFNS